MSRSYLKSKWVLKYINRFCKDEIVEQNPHKYDEMPKNWIRTPKHIVSKCKTYDHYQDPGSFTGHRPMRWGHRMVSGIVRQKNKEELRDQINSQLEDRLSSL